MQLNEGLEKLGENAFALSAIESITLPSTLRKLECETFLECGDLEKVEILNGVECIEKGCFCGSGVREITLPSSLKEMDENTLKDCVYLETVWVEKDCPLDVRRYLESNVDVLQK